MNTDLVYIISWWLMLFLAGISSIPVSWILFRKFIDLGYGFSKTVGLLAVTYFAFIGGVLKLFPLHQSWLFLISLIYILVNVYIFSIKKKVIMASIRKRLKVLIAQEALFTSGYLFWSLVRGYQPDIRGLEKFMDYGFINSILKADYLPPVDMWFAGRPINYYWFGHLWVAVATKLSGIPSAITYNLMLATILGLTLTAAFSISASLIKNLNLELAPKKAYAAGLISALLLVFAGSFHTPIYALKDGAKNYWYPDATRFIGYHPETNDKTIHEFPQYSFVVSDLHAHLINLSFVLLFLAILLSAVLNKTQDTIAGPASVPKLIALGFLLGIMFMTNAWDFGNYLLVSGVTLGVFALRKTGFKLKVILFLAMSFGIILCVAIVTALPFLLHFESIAQGIAFVKSHTPLWQLGVLWGLPATLTIIYLCFLFRLRLKLKNSDVFVLCLLGASWMLVFLPEIIFVKDIYIASHHRANTMFKLTYQAFVMFYLSSGYIAVRTIALAKRAILKIMLFTTYVVIFGSVTSYCLFAINSYYGGLINYHGLAGDAWIAGLYPSEFGAIEWLKKNVSKQPVILEAPGDSYTDFNLISAYTGLPTVSGWFVHEWLWRGDSSFPQNRVADIAQIYTSSDINLTKALLSKYSVTYIIVGTFERQKYPNLNEAKFSKLGSPVFSSGVTKIYQVSH